MNAKEYERQEVLYKIQQRNIKQQIEIKSISIKEYLNQYCAELVLDLKMIEQAYQIDTKIIFKKILLYSYEHKISKPRLRINYQKKEIELYNYKVYQSSILFRVRF